MIDPPTTIHELFARINQFLSTYGGKPTKSNSQRSLDMIADFLCVIGAELNFSVRQQQVDEQATSIPHPSQPVRDLGPETQSNQPLEK
jgi:hypothetical protein